MTKMIYVVICGNDNNLENIFFSFDQESAEQKAVIHWSKLSGHDRSEQICYVSGYEIDTESNDPKEAYDEWSDGLCWIPDPDVCIEIGKE